MQGERERCSSKCNLADLSQMRSLIGNTMKPRIKVSGVSPLPSRCTRNYDSRKKREANERREEERERERQRVHLALLRILSSSIGLRDARKHGNVRDFSLSLILQ